MNAAHYSSVRLPLPDGLVPERALRRLRPLGHAVLLESCAGGGRTLLAAAPRAVFRWTGGLGSLWEAEERTSRVRPRRTGPRPIPDPLRFMERLLPPLAADRRPGGDAGFRGGWIGYFGYEIADVLERLPPAPSAGPHDLPTLWWGAYEWAVVWSPGGRGPHLEGAPFPGGDPLELRSRMERVRCLLESREADGRTRTAPRPRVAVGSSRTASRLPQEAESSLGHRGFTAGVERIREYIRSGDLFQANLTHRLSAPYRLDGVELYLALRARSPAAYAAYLDTGEGEVASVSPESFLSLRGRRVETRPIKGTAPRAGAPAADAENARRLRESEKERAENVMIVDLLRNDLSRVCRPGSVRVPRLLELESHPTVHHLVSTVEGELRVGARPVDLLRATLPGGSITGAPKIRAMEILRELEPVRRGVYTGALGILETGGDLELSVAIRTATLRGGRVLYGTGGGITLASDPEAEWRESLDKAKAFLQALEDGHGRHHHARPPTGRGERRGARSAPGARRDPEAQKG
jgi:para-aminobenzoate synthetase component I